MCAFYFQADTKSYCKRRYLDRDLEEVREGSPLISREDSSASAKSPRLADVLKEQQGGQLG
jgi:hypothetical protein